MISKISLIFALLVPLHAAVVENDLKIKSVLDAYTTAIIDASKDPSFLIDFGDRSKFELFATQKKAQKLYVWIKSWHEGNLYMDAKLLSQKCEEVVVDTKSASVVCEEEWDYRYFKHVSKGVIEEVYSPEHISYTISYLLLEVEDKWKINDTKVISEKINK